MKGLDYAGRVLLSCHLCQYSHDNLYGTNMINSFSVLADPQLDLPSS